MGKHSDAVNTYVRQDIPPVETPTIMQIAYAKEVSDFLGLGEELNNLTYTKEEYTKFLNRYVKKYKILKKTKGEINHDKGERNSF